MNKAPKPDRQREHQANERTFLAWLRTSIALIGFGLAIARFGLFLRQLQRSLTSASASPTADPQFLGTSLVLLGIVTVAIAAWQYNRVYWQIERGNYRPNRWVIWLLAIAVMIVGALSLPLLRPPNSDQSPAPNQVEP